MDTKAETMARLHHMKVQEPFRAFNLVTTDGTVLPVNGRYRFAFSKFYVLVAGEQDRLTRVRLEKVGRIDQMN